VQLRCGRRSGRHNCGLVWLCVELKPHLKEGFKFVYKSMCGLRGSHLSACGDRRRSPPSLQRASFGEGVAPAWMGSARVSPRILAGSAVPLPSVDALRFPAHVAPTQRQFRVRSVGSVRGETAGYAMRRPRRSAPSFEASRRQKDVSSVVEWRFPSDVHSRSPCCARFWGAKFADGDQRRPLAAQERLEPREVDYT
jgi:hypothetical protein